MLEKIKILLQQNLKNKLSKEELSLLPSSYQRIGDITILNLKPDLQKYEKDIGNIVLKNVPKTETVCARTGFIKDTYREPQLKVIAGKKLTKTIHKENGITYNIDVNNIMFSKGNLTERKRIISQVEKGEIIIDMFAGIGYFSLGLGKFSKANKICAIEINPNAFKFLEENIKTNKIKNIIPIYGDCILKIPKLGKADRILMGLLPTSKDYLLDAMKAARPNTIIHYHTTGKKSDNLFEDVKIAAKISGLNVKLLKQKKVKSYAPRVYHYVLDCKII